MIVTFEEDYLNQYRIEFREILEGNKTIAEMVSLTELSNHYKKT